MKKVLIIVYNFPPRHDIASVRSKGMAKYLPEFGCEPIFLTPELPSRPDKQFNVIETPYPGNATVLAARRLGLNLKDSETHDKFRNFVSSMEWRSSLAKKAVGFLKSIIEYPDNQKAWYPFAVKAASEFIEKEKVDVIISSSPPATAHLVASELKKRYKLPWIADFRDLWSQDHYRPYGPIRRLRDKNLEIKTLAQADALVTISRPLSKNLGLLHNNKKVFTIPNGFDPEEISAEPLTKELTITYTGKFYVGKRDPILLLQALSELIEEGKIDPSLVKVRFFGQERNWLEKEIGQYGLFKVADQLGLISREDCLNKQRESQLLLLLNWDNPKDEGVYTGKIFEYLAAHRPILAVGGPTGVVSDLMEQTGSGVHVQGLEDLKKILCKLYEEYKRTGQISYHGKDEEITKYSHYEMARKFSEIIEKV